MTNPNNQTNGASLEDCHTNFFALTDLCGIKWRKVVWGDWNDVGSNTGGDVLEDPVLSGYVKCLAADILCVWRRVSAQRPHDPGAGLFDLGLGPAPPPPPTPHHHPPLSLHTAKELWIFWYGEEPDLSNLISPDLLASDTDQGSWENGLSYECRSLLFKALHNLIERCLLSRDFIRLGKWYIQPYDSNEKLLEKSGHLSFSFDFFVHGESQVCASVDVRQHPPVRTLLASHIQQAQAGLHSSPPVHVILAPFGLAGTLTGQSFRTMDPQTQRLLDGWRQFYPINKGIENSDLPPAVEVIVGGVKMRYPSSYVLITDLDESTATLFNNNQINSAPVIPPVPPPRGVNRGGHLSERVWQESCVGVVNSSEASSTPGGPPAPASPVAAPAGQWYFVCPTRKQTCSCSCKRVKGSRVWSARPFHRRPPPSLDDSTQSRLSCGGTVGQNDSVPLPSVGSPASVSASPAPVASVPPPDPAMPTLSPQPPPTHQPSPDKVVSTPTDFSVAPKSVSSITNQQILSPYGGEVGKCLSVEGKATPPVCRTVGPPLPPPPTLPKRPSLGTLEYEEALQSEMKPSSLLYDYSTLDAWLNHPVKRFKPQPIEPVVQQLQTVFKQEPSLSSSPMNVESYVGTPGDPYEFDEEALANAASNRVDNFKRQPLTNIKEEESKPLVNGSVPMQTKIGNENLFTSEGLAVSFNDLNQIFEHTDEPTFDTLQVTTPPSSNKPEEPGGMIGTMLTSGVPISGRSNTGILRPEELSKMFPTPPSLEHHPVASPITGLFSDSEFTITTMGSPNHEPIIDWSYVYKPPEACKFVGSSKYAPLTNLPSQSQPPVSLPSNCHYKPTWTTYQESKPANTRVTTTAQRSDPTPSPGWGAQAGNQVVAVGGGGMTPTMMTHLNPAGMRQVAPPPPYSPVTFPKLEPPPSPPVPEANSLVVNVLLGDSALNIFRDHNFDSCTLCVCNAGPKVVGNIRGSDAGMYLPGGGGMIPSSASPFMSPSHLPPDDEPIRCNCGFSAVVNRRLSHKSGLFIEDELEITGVLDDNIDRENTNLNGMVMELMRDQCLSVSSTSNAVFRAAAHYRPLTPVPGLNLLSLRDGTTLSAIALEQGRLANLPNMCKMEVEGCGAVRSGIHRWGYLRARGPSCNQDIIRVMKQLQPLLQDAIQKKCGTKLWEAPTVNGPLTWRQFHRLAGRGTDDRCGPQPIPSLLAGRDKDWISMSPYAVHLWEKLLLEPYSYARDIAYIVVAPDNDFVLHKVRFFFKELSSMYEVCRFGRHCPITRVLRDGILRVGKNASQRLCNEPIDDWFQMLSDNTTTTNMLKLYAQVCRSYLAPHLTSLTNNFDKSLLETNNDKPQPSPRTPAHIDQDSIVKQEPAEEGAVVPCSNTESGGGGNYNSSSVGSNINNNNNNEDDDSGPPHIVVYLVEPFTIGSDNPDLQKLSCVAMLRIYNSVLQNIPDIIRANIQLQIISLESIVELGRSGDCDRRIDHMRSLALSVFSQCRRTMHHTTTIKALTGFGTAATNELFLKNKDEKNKKPYKVYQPAYILAQKHRPLGGGGSEEAPSGGDKCCVLYVSYCLSEDQRWLLACATDDSGLLLETISINIHIPNRNRRRKASARRQGLGKLMDFILGVMSQSVVPWRLVIGRIGRIGHGELKGWSWLLSRKQLLKASKQLKEMCVQCSVLYPNDVPCILSACLVSLEPDSALRLMPDQFTPDERFSQSSTKCHLSTPQDVTATHILVFPTSATTQSSQSAFQETNLNGPDLGDDDLLMVLNDDMPEGMGDFNDIFNTWTSEGDGGGARSPGGGENCRSQPASPTQPTQPGIHSPYPNHASNQRGGELSEEVGTLLQQPLALGYLVSTAPTGRMPRWFWAACPHLEPVSPAFLKNALHLHSTAVQQNSDELLQQQSTVYACHPLDSLVTTDVLRYVLEGYNALSWLALDTNTHDRLSCLPVHMQVLMQLYHMTSALT